MVVDWLNLIQKKKKMQYTLIQFDIMECFSIAKAILNNALLLGKQQEEITLVFSAENCCCTTKTKHGKRKTQIIVLMLRWAATTEKRFSSCFAFQSYPLYETVFRKKIPVYIGTMARF